MRFDNMMPLYFQKIATYKETALDHNNTRTREKNNSRRSSGKRREKRMNFYKDRFWTIFKNESRKDIIMANSNKTLVPEAKEALNRFKMEAANEVGVNLKQGYNGNLTSKEAGSIGGQMVKKMVESYENSIKGNTNS